MHIDSLLRVYSLSEKKVVSKNIIVSLVLMSILLASVFSGTQRMLTASSQTVGNGLVAFWKQTGTSKIQILDSEWLLVNVTQYATVTATVELAISCENSRVGFYPLVQRVSVAPQQTETVGFSVSNLGVDEEIADIPITVTASDTYTGQEQAYVTVYATLLVTLIQTPTENPQLPKEEPINWTLIIIASIIAMAIIVSVAIYTKNRNRSARRI